MRELIRPCEELETAFREMASEYAAAGDGRHAEDAADFAAYLRRVRDAEAGRSPAPGRVPESHFWLVEGGRILASSRLRHRLTPELEREAGHVGYDVRPSERGKGHATFLLRATLERAAALGLRRVRVTCDSDNPASARVAEKAGGVLDAEVVSEWTGAPIRQYWIACGGAASSPDADG